MTFHEIKYVEFVAFWAKAIKIAQKESLHFIERKPCEFLCCYIWHTINSRLIKLLISALISQMWCESEATNHKMITITSCPLIYWRNFQYFTTSVYLVLYIHFFWSTGIHKGVQFGQKLRCLVKVALSLQFQYALFKLLKWARTSPTGSKSTQHKFVWVPKFIKGKPLIFCSQSISKKLLAN